MKWLDGMIDANSVNYSMSWSKYHSIASRREFETPGINSILPLIKEPVHTLKAQYHCMNIIKTTISNINPGQIPADTCDQPVYAITKEIQLRYPAEFSDDQYFTILGGLHIEKSLLGIHGEIIAVCGLAEINNLSLVGASIAALDVSDIKRSRYCLQVSLCAIYSKLKDANRNSNSSLTILEWLDERCVNSEMCCYWRSILQFEIEMLISVIF